MTTTTAPLAARSPVRRLLKPVLIGATVLLAIVLAFVFLERG